MNDMIAAANIPQSSILAMWVTFLITMVLPLIIWIVLARKWKGAGTAVLAGSLGFFIPQMLIRIPLMSLPTVSEALAGIYAVNPIFYFLLLAATAAIFETAGRLFVFKSLLKNRLSYQTAVSAGFGHGAIEAIILVGISYAGNLYFSYSINAGAMNLGQEMMGQVAAQLMQTPPELFLVGGFERICTVLFHIALSTLLCYMITKGETWKGVLYCLAAHGAIDFIVPLIQVRTGSYIITETVMLFVAIGGFLLIKSLRDKFIVTEIPEDPAKEAAHQGY